MKPISALLVSLLLSNSVFAESGSEYFHQAEIGRFEVTPTVQHLRMRAESSAAQAPLTGVDITATNFEIKSEYGINSMLSAGLILGHSNAKNQPTPSNTFKSRTSKGLNDPDFFLNGALPMGPGTFHFGTHFTYSISKSKIDVDGNSNAASGGWSLTPYAGYDFHAGPNIFGIHMSYDLAQGNRKVVDKYSTPGSEINSTDSGGQALTANYFYEYQRQMVTFGAALEVVTQRTSDRETNGVSTDQHDPLTTAQLNLYAPLRFTPNFTFIPTASYIRFIAYDTAATDTVAGMAIQVAGRLSF